MVPLNHSSFISCNFSIFSVIEEFSDTKIDTQNDQEEYNNNSKNFCYYQYGVILSLQAHE